MQKIKKMAFLLLNIFMFQVFAEDIKSTDISTVKNARRASAVVRPLQSPSVSI